MQPESWYDRNRASELPPPVSPWKRHVADEQRIPSTSLAPIEDLDPAPLEMEALEMEQVEAENMDNE